MKFIIPVESIVQNKGGVILYDPINNKILKQYVHPKQWRRSGWRGGVVYRDHLIATDWQDIHFFNIEQWKCVKTFVNKSFNDLHYLVVKEKYENDSKHDKLYVVNTGLDSIDIFEDPLYPFFEERIFVFEKNKNLFMQRSIDMNHNWRKEYKVLPHSCHPNCLCLIDDKILVTCFENHTRGRKTGKVIELNTGKVVLSNHNCHDGIFYKGDYYLSGTREHKIYIIKNILQRDWPVTIDEKINIRVSGWWRGMIIHNDIVYIFASYAYGTNSTCKMAIIDLKLKKTVSIQKLPVHNNIQWDTIYQPQLLEK